MKLLPLVLFLITATLQAQTPQSEEAFRKYFIDHKDSLDPIEGIWNVNTTQEFYRYDTMYEENRFPKAAVIAIMKQDGKYFSYNLNGEPFEVEFKTTDVKGVYLYQNYFRETNSRSKASAVISKNGEMEYTYEFPDEYIRLRFGDSYEEGTRVINILKWTKTTDEEKKKK